MLNNIQSSFPEVNNQKCNSFQYNNFSQNYNYFQNQNNLLSKPLASSKACRRSRDTGTGRPASEGDSDTLAQARPSLPKTWAAFLNKPEWHWQWYGHFTFRDRDPDASGLRRFVHPEAALKVWDGFIHQVNREIYGNRYYKRKKDGVVWARATEFQVRGAIHYHAIIGRVPDTVRRMDYVDYWFSKAGLARIYQYEQNKGAEGYLSKSCYAWKRGEIDLGGPLAVCLKESDTAVLLG